MKSLSETIRSRRKSLGLTQARLATLAKTGNRFVIDLEKGKPTLHAGKILEVLSALGLELALTEKPILGPSGRPRSLEEVVTLGAEHGETDSFLREFLDEFYTTPGQLDRTRMLTKEPPLTGNGRTDSYLAAVAEHLARRNHIPIPDWTLAPSRFLRRPYFPAGLESLKATLLMESPAAFRRRLIFVGAEPLYRPRKDAVGIGNTGTLEICDGASQEG